MARKRARSTGRLILVVDDHPEARNSLRTLLERRGHRVVTAASGSEALGVFGQSDVDLVVTDFSMPEMNGAELVGRIRALDESLPIILQTGYAVGADDGNLPQDLPVDAYHERTVGAGALLDMIETLLRSRTAPVASRDAVLPADECRCGPALPRPENGCEVSW